MKEGDAKLLRVTMWVSIFAVVMGYFEASVVVYLREIAYPGGFAFPLAPIPPGIAYTEIGREAASLLMILSVAVIAGRVRRHRFACFLIIFGIWDICYYLFLLLLLGWPSSLLTWDILFLIPVVWSAPVAAPMLVALLMILLGFQLLRTASRSAGYGRNAENRIMERREWLMLVAGALIVFLSFVWDFSRFVVIRGGGNPLSSAWELSSEYTPGSFPWLLYAPGIALILWTIAEVGRSARSRTQ
jgi:hypothetical protein